jgi:hypothetical protein
VTDDKESPNTKALDTAVKKLLTDSAATQVDELAIERRRKSIMTAIAWEKVRHAIMDNDDGFDPGDI